MVAIENEMNQLSTITGLWAKPRVLFDLKPNDFNPAPKVSSSVIRLEVFSKDQRFKGEDWVIDLIKIGFEHPRKTLFNNLSMNFDEQKIKNAFERLNFTERIRPHNLSVELWIKLAKILYCF
jgi:16S rRNA (adenine1518-N6/adenine1519-N6)-dimethyltransferase